MTTKYVPRDSSNRWYAMQYDGTNTTDILTAVNATQPNGSTGNAMSGQPGFIDDDGSGNLRTVTTTYNGVLGASPLQSLVPTGYWVVWLAEGLSSNLVTIVSSLPDFFLELA